ALVVPRRAGDLIARTWDRSTRCEDLIEACAGKTNAAVTAAAASMTSMNLLCIPTPYGSGLRSSPLPEPGSIYHVVRSEVKPKAANGASPYKTIPDGLDAS